jgi:hypothetical protein
VRLGHAGIECEGRSAPAFYKQVQALFTQTPILLHVAHSMTHAAWLHEPGRMMHVEPLLDVEVDDELLLVVLLVLLVVLLVLLVVLLLVLLLVVLLVLLDAVLLVLLAPLPPVLLLAAPPAPPTGAPPRPSRLLPSAQLAAIVAPRKRSERNKGGRMVPGSVAGSGDDGKGRAAPRTVE